MIAALIAFVAVILLITHQEAQAQVARVLARVPGSDPDATYRFAFSLMLLYVLLCTLPLLMIVAYRGLNADSLRAKVLETLSMCDLSDDQVRQRLAEYEQRNSIAAFSLPALVNLMLLYILWDSALLPRGTEGLADQILATPHPWLALAMVFPTAAASLSPLTWALLGAYFYCLALTIRRWMLYDLTTNVLWLIDVRLVTTFILGMLLMGLASATAGGSVGFGPWFAALAFFVGIVPDLFLRWIGQQLKRLGGIDTEQEGRLFGPSDLQTKLDGMSFWQVGRLAEEGVESVHDLALKELPTLIIQTRFDPALLLDWVDRALLCKQTGTDLGVFRRAHVNTATDLIALVGNGADAAAGVERLLRSFEEAAAPGLRAGGANDPGGPARPRMTAAILANIVQGLEHGPNLRHLAAYRANARRTDPAGTIPGPAATPRPMPTPGTTLVPGPVPDRAAEPHRGT